MSFENRWMIVGKLTTTSPLHIGNGDTTDHPYLINQKTGKPIEVNAICTAEDGRPYIPGSTLKGNLRAWARRVLSANTSVEQLFGSEDPEAKDSVGGKAEFYDSIAVKAPNFNERNAPPYWRSERFTGVKTCVAIDRCTRTASEERLFHQEFVPEGVVFKVEITGRNLKDAELEDLLFMLSAFRTDGIALGAGEEDGWGCVTWTLTDLRRLTREDVAAWINAATRPVGYNALTPLSAVERQSLTEKLNARQVGNSIFSLSLAVDLEFQGHFLVNDPSKAGSTEEGKTSQAPILDADGRLVLPASSFRGALRSQAERILRTLGGPHACCYPDDSGPRMSCEGIYELDQLEHLCPACKVFGAPGWKSSIEITDFKTAESVPDPSEESAKTQGHLSGKLCTQEFVAIDRFTGGAAHGSRSFDDEETQDNTAAGKKFNAKSAYRPTLEGKIRIQLNRLDRTGMFWPAIGVLALVFRDLLEGDVRLGAGAAKGYGSVLARVRLEELPAWEDTPDAVKDLLTDSDWQLSNFNALTEDVQSVLTQGVHELSLKYEGRGDGKNV